MEEEICMSCNKDNGVNNRTNCKYCGEPLCKNKWEFKHIVKTSLELESQFIIKEFEHCALPPGYELSGFRYQFECFKTTIDFEKEIIKFFVDNLNKALFIHFSDVYQMRLSRHPNFRHYSSLILILDNKTKIDINRNNINSKLFEVLDKFLETKDTKLVNNNISQNKNTISVY